MKINRLETHDRFLEFQKQAESISKGCQDCTNNRPPQFGNHPFYIFAHKREIALDERTSIYNEDYYHSIVGNGYFRRYNSLLDVPTARIIWQPRLAKPQAQENSMLFKAYPGTDNIKIVWMIPARELWEQYEKGKLTENKLVSESIHDFQHARGRLEEKEEDDLDDEKINAIYEEISRQAKLSKRFGKI